MSNFGDNSIQGWFRTEQGKAVLNLELSAIRTLPERLFGHYILQLGGSNDIDLLSASSVQKQIHINSNSKYLPAKCDYSICADLTELPLMPNSVDAVVMFHVLEFVKQPRQVLREVFAALIPEGYAVIFSFNPFSLWGLLRLFKNRRIAPWDGRYVDAIRMQHWLNELGFTVVSKQTLLFRPPFSQYKKLHKYLFMEGLGQMFMSSFGSVNMFLVKKKITTLTIIKSRGAVLAPITRLSRP